MHPNKWGTNIKKDPMSHRIIEKRRRDRMNNCLADLSRLVPTNYLKKGRGRIEKTEIIEMAIKHLKHLQAHPCKDPANCEVAKTTEQDHKRQYRLGYHECMSETVRFMVESEGLFSGDSVCVRLINHLQKHYDKVSGGICYTQALGMMLNEDTKSTVQMEVDTQLSNSNNCFPTPDSNSGPPPLTDNGYPSPAPFQFEPQHPHSTPNGDSAMVPPPELKQEEVVVATPTPVKATSQLREMLQNPGLPPKTALAPPPVVVEPKPEESCYKFKNNIKHRFNNDLRHHTSSPTDHLMGEEDHNNNKILHPSSDPYGTLRHGGVGHAFSPYPSHHSHHEKGDQPWEASSSPAETTASSSCGSNPSPPPARSCCNGSSSGYSTAGETPNAPVGPLKASPASYSSSSRRSPSPVPGVPIFALHPKGTFYVPLTIEASLLVPYMSGLDDLAPVLHPISICVNLSSHSLKVEGPGHHYARPHSSFLMDKFHDRYVYAEKPQYYPSSTSPQRT